MLNERAFETLEMVFCFFVCLYVTTVDFVSNLLIACYDFDSLVERLLRQMKTDRFEDSTDDYHGNNHDPWPVT